MMEMAAKLHRRAAVVAAGLTENGVFNHSTHHPCMTKTVDGDPTKGDATVVQ
jgi:hypothetical protein